MRILMIMPLYPPAVGGAASYVREIAPRLEAQQEVEHLVILTERMPGQPRVSGQGKLRVLRYLPTRVSLPRRTWLGHAISYVLTQIWFALALAPLVRRNRIDLVHFHTRYRGRTFYRILARLPVPVIADLRDRMSDPRALADVATLILTCAQGIQRFVQDAGVSPGQTWLIPNLFVPPSLMSAEAVAAAKREQGIVPPDYLLYVGDMNQNKGVYDLLDALDLLPEPTPLLLVGTNREGQRFLDQVARCSHARYLGQLPHKTVLALMAGAQAVLLPSRSEALGAVMLEALAVGTRVVCPPDVPEFAATMPEQVLPKVTPQAIAETLQQVLALPLPSYPFEQHDPQRVVAALMDVYRQLIGAKEA